WDTTAGLILLDLVALPGAGYFYFLIAGLSDGRSAMTEQERRIRDVAGQEERNRLAQDLHDSVKQQIYSVQASLAAVKARWESDAQGAYDAVEHARTSARDAMTEMTALLDRLRKDPVESVGLVEALRRQCDALGHQTGAELSVRFGDLPSPGQVPPASMT